MKSWLALPDFVSELQRQDTSFPIYKGQTLEQTHLGVNILESLRMKDTEPTTTYDSFTDLVSTLDNIVRLERNDTATSILTINAQDPNPEINRNDHKDHLTVGCVASSIARKSSGRLNLYVDYHSKNLPENLSQESVAIKTRLMTIFDSKVGIGIGPEFQAWIRRTIFRTIQEFPATDDLLLYKIGQRIGRYKSLFSGCEKNYWDWRSSWELLAPGSFTGRGEAEIFLYDPLRREANLVNTRDKYVQTTYSRFRQNWSSIVPVRRSGKDALLFYSRETGEAELWDLSNSQMKLLKSFMGWRNSWKFILSGNFTGHETDSLETTELFFYDDTTGDAEIRRINDDSMTLVDSYSGWRTTWCTAVAGDFSGSSNDDILFFDSKTGEVNILISRPGQPFLQQAYSGWSRSSRLLTTARYGRAKISVLIHDPSTSVLEIWDFNNGRQLAGEAVLRGEWDRALSGTFGEVTITK